MPRARHHTLTATFTNNSNATTPPVPGSFLVAITDANGANIGSGEIRFNSGGTLVAGYTSLTANLPIAAARSRFRSTSALQARSTA